MSAVRKSEAKQGMEWDGRRGNAWVEAQELVDRLFQPFENMLADAVAAEGGRNVLDIGCGTGSTTLVIARNLGASGRVVGVDISGPMIAAARMRVERERLPATFVCADAQTYPFERAAHDTIISRFGVMFFSDPVLAFANLRQSAREGAALRSLVWRSAGDNPFMTVAERAAGALLPNLPSRKPDEPGQFAFADAQRVTGILERSGWKDVDIRPVDVECVFPEHDLVPYLTRLGPVGVALQSADDATRTRVSDAVRAAFDPYVQGAEVRFTAACSMVAARAPTCA
ncbi:MAG: class I SAM-dependent methyltransferase [Gammaproteobacteria bacterium]